MEVEKYESICITGIYGNNFITIEALIGDANLSIKINDNDEIVLDNEKLKELLPHLIQWQCTGSLELPELGKEKSEK